MRKYLLNISLILLSFTYSVAQNNNYFELGMGSSYRISDKRIFRKSNLENAQKDLPAFMWQLEFGRKIYKWKDANALFMSFSYTQIGFRSNKLHYPSVPDPFWGGTVNDEYYLKEVLELKNLGIGFSYKRNINAKSSLGLKANANYLIRVSQRTKTIYPDADFLSYSRFRFNNLFAPNGGVFNRVSATTALSFDRQIINFDHHVGLELGSYMSKLYQENLKVFPIWMCVKYQYSL